MKIILFLSVAILTFGCKNKKSHLPTPAEVAPPVAVSEGIDDSIKDEIVKKRIDYTTFQAKIKVQSERNGNSNPNAEANVKMIKDSCIWISITATLVGLEIIRLYVTPDSVTMIDKLNSTYTTKPISFLQEITGIPFTLQSFQDFLVGNPTFINFDKATFSTTSSGYTVDYRQEQMRTVIVYGEAPLLLDKLILENEASKDFASIIHSSYSSDFSQERKIFAKSDDEIRAQLEYKTYEFNKSLQYSLQVPKNYTRK